MNKLQALNHVHTHKWLKHIEFNGGKINSGPCKPTF